MPAKTSKNKTEKTSQPKRRMTAAQIFFVVIAVIIILTMVLSMVSKI